MDYLEVVDEYSSHEFLMRRGQVLHDTPEFQSYMRLHAQTWHQIQFVIEQLASFLSQFEVSLANIDGKKVKTFASMDRELTPLELFECIVNKDQMSSLVQNHPKLKYALDHQKAAFKVQSLFRMVVIRKDYGRIKVLIKKVMVI